MAEIIALGGLTIIYVALSLLSLDPKNPRQHSKRQIRDIARSIKTFGHIVPILIDCHNRIVAGHGRYLWNATFPLGYQRREPGRGRML